MTPCASGSCLNFPKVDKSVLKSLRLIVTRRCSIMRCNIFLKSAASCEGSKCRLCLCAARRSSSHQRRKSLSAAAIRRPFFCPPSATGEEETMEALRSMNAAPSFNFLITGVLTPESNPTIFRIRFKSPTICSRHLCCSSGTRVIWKTSAHMVKAARGLRMS